MRLNGIGRGKWLGLSAACAGFLLAGYANAESVQTVSVRIVNRNCQTIFGQPVNFHLGNGTAKGRNVHPGCSDLWSGSLAKGNSVTLNAQKTGTDAKACTYRTEAEGVVGHGDATDDVMPIDPSVTLYEQTCSLDGLICNCHRTATKK